MRIQLVTVGLFLLCSIAANSEDKLYAPLPDKVVAAKTVFFVNDSGTSRFGDDLYRQLKSWNRWEVVSDREKADLILVLSASDTAPVTVTAIQSFHHLAQAFTFYFVQDGFHRIEAARRYGLQEMEAEVLPGTLKEMESEFRRMLDVLHADLRKSEQ